MVGGVFLYSVISNDREKSLLLKLGTILDSLSDLSFHSR